MRPRSLLADLGPGGAAGIAVLTVLTGLRAAALLLIAEGIAESIASLAAGHGPAAGALVLAAAGVVLRAAASWGTTVTSTRVAARTKRRWRELLAGHVARNGTNGGTEETLLATRGLDDLDGYIGTVLPAMVGALVIPLALGLRILVADPLSALIIAVTIPLIPVFMVLIGMHSKERADAAAGALGRLGDHLVELAEGLPVLVGLGRAAEQTEALATIQDGYRKRLDRAVRTALLSALALELIGTLSVAVIAVTLGIRLLSGGMALDVALIVLLLAPDCFTALREVGAAYHQAQDGRTALERIRGVLQRTRTEVRRRTGAPALAGLTVRHPGRGQVGPISADLPSTGIVGIAGPSGAGKSTLLDAIAGAGDPDAAVTGTLIGFPEDGLAVARQAPRFAAATPRAELALVGDDGTLLDELGIGGLADAPIGRLSPGEQRRVAVARALGRVDAGAGVLLLDEPTAHLDDENAAAVVAAIGRRRGRSLILVASHDPAVQALADRVVEVRMEPEPAPDAAMAADDSAIPGTAAVSAAGAGLGRSRIRSGAETRRRPASHGWRTWTGAVLLGALAAGMSLALTGVSGWLIVRAAAQPAIMYLLVAIVGVRFFGLGRAVARYVERITSHRAAFELVDEVRLRLWRRLADLGAAARGARDPGRALELLVTLPAQLQELLPRIVTPLAAGVMAGIGTAVTLVVVAPAAWPAAAVLAATTLAAPALSWRADRRGQREVVATSGALTRRFASFCSAGPDLRANGMTEPVVERLARDTRGLERAERRQGIVTAGAGIVAGLGTGLAAILAPLLVTRADTAAVIALLCIACLEPIAGAAAGAQRLPALVAVVHRLRAGFAGSPRPAGGEPLASETVERIRLDDLSLAWDGRPVVEHLDAVVDRSGWVALDGPSGSGKTTLVTALLGDLLPVGGAIEVDGRALSGIDREDWRTRIAWCPQEAHIFDSTLRANLLIARPRTDPVADEEARRALRQVGLGHLLQTPDGLELRVGRRGSALSGGERQRLAVARALLRGGDVLVLDEPTAHLDEARADRMMDDLRRATDGRLVVLVSHRRADRDRAVSTVRFGAARMDAIAVA